MVYLQRLAVFFLLLTNSCGCWVQSEALVPCRGGKEGVETSLLCVQFADVRNFICTSEHLKHLSHELGKELSG